MQAAATITTATFGTANASAKKYTKCFRTSRFVWNYYSRYSSTPTDTGHCREHKQNLWFLFLRSGRLEFALHDVTEINFVYVRKRLESVV